MIPVEQPHLTVAALSHPGESGKNNEDRFAVAAFQLESDRTPALVAALADGIGGHPGGEVAAQLVIEALLAALARSSGRDPVHQLEAAVVEAGRAVTRASQEAPEHAGMGATLAAIWVIGARLYVAYVGDSRIYLLRQGELRRLSIDHTWVQEAIEAGVITPDEARDHPHAHVLRRHLGGQQEPQPDMRLRFAADESDEESIAHQGLALKSGDQLLLCSDGLTDLVEDPEIADILPGRQPRAAAQALVDLARSRGGFDNITAIVAGVPPSVGRKHRRAALPGLTLAALALTALAVLGLAGLWRMGLWPWSAPAPSTPARLPTLSALTPEPTTPVPVPSPSPAPTLAPTLAPTPAPSTTPIPLPTVAPPAI